MADPSGELAGEASLLAVPLAVDSLGPPRLVFGSLDLHSPNGADQAYTALYFEVAHSADLGRVTFEGLDAVRGARGEQLPYGAVRQNPDDWVFVVERTAWLRERHAYEMHHYATPLLETHQHYVFAFHDEFIEAIAEGIWLDLADKDDPFAVPTVHPLNPLPEDLPAERFTSTDGLTWELRRSPRTDAELIHASQFCSQRVYQLNLVLDGDSRESASIWIRTRNGALVSRFSRPWPVGETARMFGFANPAHFTEQWVTYVGEVAQRRRQMGKR